MARRSMTLMFAIYDPVHLNAALGALVEAAVEGDHKAVEAGLLWLYEESDADLRPDETPPPMVALLNDYRAEALDQLGLADHFD
jgi:hypothetical protein